MEQNFGEKNSKLLKELNSLNANTGGELEYLTIMAGPVGDGGGKTRPDLEKLYKNAKSEQIPQIDQIIKETCKIDIGDIRRKLISLEHQKKGSQTPLGEESEAVMIVNSEGKATFDTEDLRKSIEKLKKLFDNDDPLGFASKLDFEN